MQQSCLVALEVIDNAVSGGHDDLRRQTAGPEDQLTAEMMAAWSNHVAVRPS